MDVQRGSNLMNSLEISFIYFIVLQPFLDVLAYFHLPVSDILRVFAMMAGVIYIGLKLSNKERKLALIYLIIVAIYMDICVPVHFITNDQFSLIPEMTYMIKTFFFVEMLIVYIVVIKSFSTKTNWQKIMERCVYFSMSCIGIVMLLATLTETGKRSYNAIAKSGHSGWFFSGNELSSILAIGFGIMVLYMLKKDSLLGKVKLLPLIGLVIWSMLMIGTKVSFGSVIIVLSISILIVIINSFFNKKQRVNMLILIPTLLVTILITPLTPIGNNLDFFFDLNIQKEEGTSVNQKDQVKEDKSSTPQLLSGRSDFLNEAQKQYMEAPLIQKAFGMGIRKNGSGGLDVIEMDFFDWFFKFGFIGLTLLLLPLIYIGYHILTNLLKGRVKMLNITVLLVGLAVCLGLGSAFVAGHVLSSPAVSIYLAYLIGYLFVLSNYIRVKKV